MISCLRPVLCLLMDPCAVLGMFLGLLDPDLLSEVLRILPFSHKGVEWTEIMHVKLNLTQNFSTKLNFLD
jgi:hypothetical protein